MSNKEFQDSELIDAIMFFGVQNNIDRAKDIKWLQEQNVIHSLSISKKNDSNKYFGILKLQQHRIDYVFEIMKKNMAIELSDSTLEESENDKGKEWYDKAPTRRSNPQPQPAPSRKTQDSELQQFGEQVRRSFKTVPIEGDNIARKTSDEKSRLEFEMEYRKRKGKSNHDAYGDRNINTRNKHHGKPDGVVKAGCVLTIIANIITMLILLPFIGTLGAPFVVLALGVQIITLVLNVKTYSGTAKSNIGAGVMGLLFAGFLGGLLTLCGRYFE